MRKFSLIPLLLVAFSAVAGEMVEQTKQVEVPTMAEFEALEQRVADLEGSGGGSVSIAHWNSGDNSELADTVPGNYEQVEIYRVNVGAVQQGDVLIVLGEVEGTNDRNDNVLFSTRTLLHSYTSSGGVGAQEISEGNGFNITPNMHHGTSTVVGTIVVPYTKDEAWVSLYAMSNKGVDTIEQDYGRLSVVRIRQ